MNEIQNVSFVLLIVFYVTYFIKKFRLNNQGIQVVLLGKGNKEKQIFLLEMVLKIHTVILALLQFTSIVFSKALFGFQSPLWLQAIGIGIMIVGVTFFSLAIIHMKTNWRAGFSENQNTNLVTNGIYSISRNPAFVGFDLLYIGLMFVFPNPLLLFASILGVILFHLEIKNEEQYCRSAFQEEYIEYYSRVKRYIGRQ